MSLLDKLELDKIELNDKIATLELEKETVEVQIEDITKDMVDLEILRAELNGNIIKSYRMLDDLEIVSNYLDNQVTEEEIMGMEDAPLEPVEPEFQ